MPAENPSRLRPPRGEPISEQSAGRHLEGARRPDSAGDQRGVDLGHQLAGAPLIALQDLADTTI